MALGLTDKEHSKKLGKPKLLSLANRRIRGNIKEIFKIMKKII